MADQQPVKSINPVEGEDTGVFRTLHQQTELYVMLIWNETRKCHQHVVRHTAEDLINITHMLKVFVGDKNESKKIVAKERRKALSLLRNAVKLSGHRGYRGTFISCKDAKSLILQEFEGRDELQRLQPILRTSPDDKHHFLSLQDIIVFNQEGEGQQPLPNPQNIEKVYSSTKSEETEEADGTVSQPIIAEDMSCNDLIVVQSRNVPSLDLRTATAERSSSDSPQNSPTSCTNSTSISPVRVSKRQLPIEMEEITVAKKPKSKIQTPPWRTVDKSSKTPLLNTTRQHLSQQARHSNRESQGPMIQTISNSISDRPLEISDINAQWHTAERCQARAELLASQTAILNVWKQSSRASLESAQSELSKKQLALDDLNREIEALTCEVGKKAAVFEAFELELSEKEKEKLELAPCKAELARILRPRLDKLSVYFSGEI